MLRPAIGSVSYLVVEGPWNNGSRFAIVARRITKVAMPPLLSTSAVATCSFEQA